jgi:hypothetical protein
VNENNIRLTIKSALIVKKYFGIKNNCLLGQKGPEGLAFFPGLNKNSKQDKCSLSASARNSRAEFSSREYVLMRVIC